MIPWLQRNLEVIIKPLTDNSLIKSLIYPVYKLLNISELRYRLRNKMYKSGVEELLIRSKDVLDSINAIFWLDFGTLLGAIREGDFIKHDLDIDLGMFLEDYSEKIDNAMEQAGFRKTFQFEIEGGKRGLEQSYEFNGVKVDIFYYQKKESKMWTYIFLSKNKGSNQMQPIAQYFPNNGFEKFIFKGMDFFIPKNPEKYLAYHYGEDFMVPKKNWDYRKDALHTEYEKKLEGLKIKY